MSQLEKQFAATAFEGIAANAFLLMLGLEATRALEAAATAENSQGVPIDLSQQSLHAIGKAIGLALLGTGGVDQVMLKRFQHAVADGMSDLCRLDQAEAAPLLDNLFASTGATFNAFKAAYVSEPLQEKPRLILPDQKVVTL